MKHMPKNALPFVTCLIAALMMAAAPVIGEEIRLHDDSRIQGIVNQVDEDGNLVVFTPAGEDVVVPIQDIISINFLGRSPLLVESGTQEFRFVNHGQLLGQILGHQGDKVTVDSGMAGIVHIDLKHIRGFVSLPMVGHSSLLADEIVERAPRDRTKHHDVFIDRRGSEVAGVLRRLERTYLHLDIDDLLNVRPFSIYHLRGVRLADATRSPARSWDGEILLDVGGRDLSTLPGEIVDIRRRQWKLNTDWHPAAPVEIPLDEIAQVRVIGGRVQYLSQLTPIAVDESTIIAPPQPYQMDRNCQGDTLSIAGQRYPWGIGVHANSKLTFSLNSRYNEFKADIGIDTRIGDRGSVVFKVEGDGKTLYTSPTVRGSDPEPRSISVPVKGVNELTLVVSCGDELDLGGVANWAAARVIR